MGKHIFDTDVAQEVGVNAAIILENIAHWVEHNRANGVNYHDGRFWTFNSVKAFEELFPYLTPRAIRTALEKLETEGYITTGNYNKSTYDRTKWYALTDKANAFYKLDNSICQNCQMDSTEMTNQSVKPDKPIPDINTTVTTSVNPDNKQSKRTRFSRPSLEEVQNYCKERGNSVDAKSFIDYYEMTGWKTKGGAKIKDWKACIRTWERRENTTRPNGKPRAQQPVLTEREKEIKEQNRRNISAWAQLGLTE